MRKTSVVFVFGALIWPANQATAAQSAVAQAVQRLHLSAQQLLSLRDFLGPFSRGTDIEASGDGLFVVRDTATMAYSGELSLRVSSDGRLQVDRVGGHAKLDNSHVVMLPLRLTAKARADAMAALANSDAAKPEHRVSAEAMNSIEPARVLPYPAVAAAKLTDAIAHNMTQSRAEFWPDGSGWSATVRFQTGTAASSLGMTERFFSPIRADATKVWRDSVVEIAGDVKLNFPDFESRYACAPTGGCADAKTLSPERGLHVIRWSKSLIAAIPPSLMAQLTAPVVAVPAAQPAAEGATQTGEDAAGFGTSPGTALPTPSAGAVPQSPNGG